MSRRVSLTSVTHEDGSVTPALAVPVFVVSASTITVFSHAVFIEYVKQLPPEQQVLVVVSPMELSDIGALISQTAYQLAFAAVLTGAVVGLNHALCCYATPWRSVMANLRLATMHAPRVVLAGTVVGALGGLAVATVNAPDSHFFSGVPSIYVALYFTSFLPGQLLFHAAVGRFVGQFASSSMFAVSRMRSRGNATDGGV